MANGIDRRELIKIGVGAVVSTGVAGAVEAHKFFTDAEYTAVDELTEMMIPTDDHSPGAKAAKVVDYIDRLLGEAFEPEERNDFRAGLKPYVEATPEQREAMLKKASVLKPANRSMEAKFFRLLKEHTIKGYYTSSIGIHDDLQYKGNVYQTGEYAGFLPS
jgi:hypothetical protein